MNKTASMDLPPTIVCNVESSVILVVGGTDNLSEVCINNPSEEAEVSKVISWILMYQMIFS